MKQIVMGILCCAITIYTIISCLSIYSISSRRNEIENCVSQVLKQNLENYYVQPLVAGGEPVRQYLDSEVAAFVSQDLTAQLRSDSEVQIDVRACDMEKGVISVDVKERFFLPNGMEKTLLCRKTIIVE